MFFFRSHELAAKKPPQVRLASCQAAAADVFAKEVGEKKATVEEESAKVRLMMTPNDKFIRKNMEVTAKAKIFDISKCELVGETMNQLITCSMLWHVVTILFGYQDPGRVATSLGGGWSWKVRQDRQGGPAENSPVSSSHRLHLFGISNGP